MLADPKTQELPSNRAFGLVFFAFFLIVAAWPLFTGRPPRIWALAASGAFLLLSLLVPAWLAPANRLWMRFGALLHGIVSPVVLAVMFYGVVLPTGLVMRALGKDALRLRFDRTARSYWIKREPAGPRPDSFRDQF
jgi:hypothetical protein